MARRSLTARTCFALLSAVAAVAVLVPFAGLGAGLLFVAPAVIAVAVLAAGWFPGEAVLVAARERGRRRRIRAPQRVSVAWAAPVLGRALSPVAGCAAGRAPPTIA